MATFAGGSKGIGLGSSGWRALDSSGQLWPLEKEKGLEKEKKKKKRRKKKKRKRKRNSNKKKKQKTTLVLANSPGGPPEGPGPSFSQTHLVAPRGPRTLVLANSSGDPHRALDPRSRKLTW